MSYTEPPFGTMTSDRQEGIPRCETARLVLQEWVQDDLHDLIEGLNNLSVSRWLAFVTHPYTAEDAHDWLIYCKRLASKGQQLSDYEFAIELKAEHKVIGGVSLTRVSSMHGTAGGGIWINARYHGYGYGTEAFGEKIRFAFEELHLRRLDNGYFTGNDASFAMQQRFGYKREGIRRQAYCCRVDGEIKDECLMGLRKEEWQQ